MDKKLQARVGSQAWYQRYPRGLPLALFLMAVAVTASSVAGIEAAQRNSRQSDLERNATEIAAALQRRIGANIAYLQAGAALFSTQQSVPAPLFQTFINQLRLDENYRGAQGIGWAMRVEPQAIAAVEKAMRGYAPGNFRVWPRPKAGEPFAVPIIYIQPDDDRNRRVIGFNMYSEKVRRAAMDAAGGLKRPVVSGKVTLVQENGKDSQAGFLIYAAVYEGGNGTSPVRVKGYVYSPFRATDFLQSARTLYSAKNMGIRLYDGVADPDTLLAEVPVIGDAGMSTTMPFRVGTRQWVIHVRQPAIHTLSTLSMLTLLFGAVVASLLLVVARLITKRAQDDRAALTWATQQAAIRTTLTRELNHRVKNTLANVLSIVALTKRQAPDLDSYVEKLNGRIRALSATHDLLTTSEWGSTLMRQVVKAELAPYALASESHILLSGPDISLAPNDALSLGLAIHELVTNAAKYGALSNETGRVHIEWAMAGADRATLIWREEGGPRVEHPKTRGFGSDLIEKVVAHELRSKVELVFDPAGVRCTLVVPVRAAGPFTLRTPISAKDG